MSDNEVLALSTKDPNAFEVIVNRYEQAFINKITAILKNRQEAEDIVQDSFVKIYLNAHRFKVQEGATFKSWAYKILLNTCFTYCKKNKRQKEFVNNVDMETLNLASAGMGEYEKKLDIDHFLMVASKIPETFRRALHSVIFEGKTHEDLALQEGISVGAARTRLHRARKEFKKTSALYF